MNLQKILGLLQGCHSILGLAWPKPGIPQMAGASIFIGTNPFVALEDGVRQTGEEFASLYKLQNMQTACEAWRLLTEIVRRFKILGRHSQSPAIDPAFNLIYLTTGVLYYHISTTFSIVPAHVQPFATVEPLEKLLSICSWKQSEDDDRTQKIMGELITKLCESLADLQK